jgi:hypothetical protein
MKTKQEIKRRTQKQINDKNSKKANTKKKTPHRRKYKKLNINLNIRIFNQSSPPLL